MVVALGVGSRLELIIEAGCLAGMVVLAFASTRLLTGKGWDRGLWLRFGAALLVALASIFVINSETRPDPFPVVVGGCLLVAVLILVLIALTLSWRRLHRRGDQRVIAKRRETSSTWCCSACLRLPALLGRWPSVSPRPRRSPVTSLIERRPTARPGVRVRAGAS